MFCYNLLILIISSLPRIVSIRVSLFKGDQDNTLVVEIQKARAVTDPGSGEFLYRVIERFRVTTDRKVLLYVIDVRTLHWNL